MLLRPLLLALSLLPALAGAAAAGSPSCQGRDLLAGLAPEARAEIDRTVAAAPFAQGNHWQARRGQQVIDIVGTFHLYDPRMDAPLARLKPLIAGAGRIYLEATDKEIAELKQAMGARPDMIVLQGPTLRERLSDTDWQRLAAAMTARGIPPFVAAKFQPWYVSMMLGVPACAMSAIGRGSDGLDHLIGEEARAAGVPLSALEPYDALFTALGNLSGDEQVEMIREALLTEPQSEDLMATMTDAYFREDHRMVWEFGKYLALHAPGADPARVAAGAARLEDLLIDRRNAAWAEVLRKAPEKRLLVAVGAGHLAGEKGLLNLLRQQGFTLERQAF
ncbi:MAG: TraB/GumN family protein [Proteobacteria bacterium]|nr:TraB/GumN family protein [Pseudomonadota bacterium]MBS0573786.1 TraB/GumN family protein [Pseudomonadota bacterium]